MRRRIAGLRPATAHPPVKARLEAAPAPGRAKAFGRGLATWLLAATVLASAPATAFRLIGSGGAWARWDAAPRMVEGVERSLDGGLRYSIETGSYAALRDQFIWVGAPPSEQAFADAIARAFEHWEVIDAQTGYPAGFHFVEDLATPAVDDPGAPAGPNRYVGLNAGAEIDIFAETPHAGMNFGASVLFFVDSIEDDLELTSGTTNYPGFAISGADIRINPMFAWSLSGFEILLTHEIGHALGLADLEADVASGAVSGFIDDDYDPMSSSSAASTLTDAFVFLINPIDPQLSPLQSFAGAMAADPGLQTAGVELLMESEGIFDLTYAPQKLQPDDIAGRQFLYPVVVPEPGMIWMLAAGSALLVVFARDRESGESKRGAGRRRRETH